MLKRIFLLYQKMLCQELMFGAEADTSDINPKERKCFTFYQN